MGYTHGIRWSEDLIKEKLNHIVTKFNLKFFPSVSQLNVLNGNHSLSNAICKKGGVRYWAEQINIPLRNCETFFGEDYEEKCFDKLTSLGYEVEQMTTRYPYDLTANKHIKIDVKVGKLYTNKKVGSFYTFNLEKRHPTCDVYICYCVNDSCDIDKVYIIPSKVMHGKKQLSVGQNESIYDSYKNNWEVLKIYDEFYKLLGA